MTKQEAYKFIDRWAVAFDWEEALVSGDKTVAGIITELKRYLMVYPERKLDDWSTIETVVAESATNPRQPRIPQGWKYLLDRKIHVRVVSREEDPPVLSKVMLIELRGGAVAVVEKRYEQTEEGYQPNPFDVRICYASPVLYYWPT